MPHDWLFPQLAAAIHHGGAGTTAAAIKAGIPSIAVPSFADQVFWGQQISKISVGLPPIKKEELSVEKLLKAIKELTSNQDIRMKVLQIGNQVKKENGAEKAASLIDEHILNGS